LNSPRQLRASSILSLEIWTSAQSRKWTRWLQVRSAAGFAGNLEPGNQSNQIQVEPRRRALLNLFLLFEQCLNEYSRTLWRAARWKAQALRCCGRFLPVTNSDRNRPCEVRHLHGFGKPVGHASWKPQGLRFNSKTPFMRKSDHRKWHFYRFGLSLTNIQMTNSCLLKSERKNPNL